MTTRKIKIKSVKVLKEGEGQYGKWKLLEITDYEGEVYKSFDDLLELAQGQEVEVEIEIQEREYKGKVYYSKMIKTLKCKGCYHCPNVK